MKQFFAVLTFVVVFVSCKKNEGTSTSSFVVPKIKSLSFTYYDDTSHSAHQSIDFLYDGLGRVQEMFCHYGNYGDIVLRADSIFLYNFYYRNNEQLPYFVVSKNLYDTLLPSLPMIFNNHFSYYDSSKFFSDSIILVNNGNTKNVFYKYENNNLITYTYPYDPPNQNLAYTINFPLKDQNFIGNYLTQPKGSKYEYDNKINPLSYLNISPIWPAISYDWGQNPMYTWWSLWTLNGKNNVLAFWPQLNYPTEPAGYLVEYEYNSDNLPISRIYKSYPGYNKVDSMHYNYR